MLNKIIEPKGINGLGAINYCLNSERVKNQTAKILKGDELRTRAIISSLSFKNKVTFGVLTFSEQYNDLTDKQKKEIINGFEHALLGDMYDRVNILWVEHIDKGGRLELNYLIPNVDMQTKKNYTPYYDKRDRSRIYHFCEATNIKYNLSSPHDPQRARSIRGNSKSLAFKDISALDEYIQQQVKDGLLLSRKEIVQHIRELSSEALSIEVVNERTNNITVSIGGKKPRALRGGIYNEQFGELDSVRGSIRERETILAENEKRARDFGLKRTRKEFEYHTERMEAGIKELNRTNKQRYPEATERSSPRVETQQETIGNYGKERNNASQYDFIWLVGGRGDNNTSRIFRNNIVNKRIDDGFNQGAIQRNQEANQRSRESASINKEIERREQQLINSVSEPNQRTQGADSELAEREREAKRIREIERRVATERAEFNSRIREKLIRGFRAGIDRTIKQRMANFKERIARFAKRIGECGEKNGAISSSIQRIRRSIESIIAIRNAEYERQETIKKTVKSKGQQGFGMDF